MRRAVVFALTAFGLLILLISPMAPIWISVQEGYGTEAANTLLNWGLAGALLSLVISILVLYMSVKATQNRTRE